jgi:hypothetical protein
MKKLCTLMLLLGALTLVGCGTKTADQSISTSTSEVAEFVLDLEPETEKSVEEYLMEAEAAKEKLRALLEKKAEMQTDQSEDTASLLNFFISTVSAEDEVEEDIDEQIEALLEEIEEAIENAEEAVESEEEAVVVQEAAEAITDEVEEAAEENGADDLV